MQYDVKEKNYMDMRLKEKVIIPEGAFEGNCRDCIYADWHDTDSYGRVYCRGSYGRKIGMVVFIIDNFMKPYGI